MLALCLRAGELDYRRALRLPNRLIEVWLQFLALEDVEPGEGAELAVREMTPAESAAHLRAALGVKWQTPQA